MVRQLPAEPSHSPPRSPLPRCPVMQRCRANGPSSRRWKPTSGIALLTSTAVTMGGFRSSRPTPRASSMVRPCHALGFVLFSCAIHLFFAEPHQNLACFASPLSSPLFFSLFRGERQRSQRRRSRKRRRGVLCCPRRLARVGGSRLHARERWCVGRRRDYRQRHCGRYPPTSAGDLKF